MKELKLNEFRAWLMSKNSDDKVCEYDNCPLMQYLMEQGENITIMNGVRYGRLRNLMRTPDWASAFIRLVDAGPSWHKVRAGLLLVVLDSISIKEPSNANNI